MPNHQNPKFSQFSLIEPGVGYITHVLYGAAHTYMEDFFDAGVRDDDARYSKNKSSDCLDHYFVCPHQYDERIHWPSKIAQVFLQQQQYALKHTHCHAHEGDLELLFGHTHYEHVFRPSMMGLQVRQELFSDGFLCTSLSNNDNWHWLEIEIDIERSRFHSWRMI